MCGFCCKEFKGWRKSFTWTEIALSVLEGALLVLLLVCLIVTVLHLLACSRRAAVSVIAVTTPLSAAALVHAAPTTPRSCTWVPSHKTKSVTTYYEDEMQEMSGTVPTPAAAASALPASVLLEARREPAASEAEARGAATALVCAGRVACAAVALSARWALAPARCAAAALGPGCELAGGGALRRVHTHGDGALLLAAGSLPHPATAPAPLLRHLTAMGERLTMITYAYNVSLEEAKVRSDSVWVTETARCRGGRNVLCASTLRTAGCGGGGGGGGRAGGALLRGRTVLGVTGGARRCGYVRFNDLLNDFAWIREMLASEIKDE